MLFEQGFVEDFGDALLALPLVPWVLGLLAGRTATFVKFASCAHLQTISPLAMCGTLGTIGGNH